MNAVPRAGVERVMEVSQEGQDVRRSSPMIDLN